MAMKLTFGEAEFIAMLFDATLRQTAHHKTHYQEFEAAQTFLGVQMPESEKEGIEIFETMEVEMFNIRERIRENYGI